MTMRFKVPPGDVPPAVAARYMGLSLEQFLEILPKWLECKPAFPAADPYSGNYDLDAIAAWRRARYPQLFRDPSLTLAPTARDARDVVRNRMARGAGG